LSSAAEKALARKLSAAHTKKDKFLSAAVRFLP